VHLKTQVSTECIATKLFTAQRKRKKGETGSTMWETIIHPGRMLPQDILPRPFRN